MIKYLTHDLRKVWACDIEANSLTPTVVWCLCCVNADTKEEVHLRTYPELLSWVNDRQNEGCLFVFHNGLNYDAPNLNSLVKTKLTLSNIIDTLVMSMVYSPSLEGGHSLEDWGDRLKFPKGEWDEWDRWSQEMEDYCLRDAHLCLLTYLELRRRMVQAGFTEEGLELEHRSWVYIKKQKENGFFFNFPEAMALYSKIRAIEKEISDEVHTIWPPLLLPANTYIRAFRKDGSDSATFTRHKQQYPRVALRDDGSYTVFDYVSFNIGSPIQRVEKLLELGWNPEEFTKPSKSHPKGQPQPVVKGKLSPSLERFVEESGHPGARLIAKWIDYNARGNMINTWMEAYNHDTKCIHGSLWLANTLRYRHSNPNTANIPAVRLDSFDAPLRGAAGVFTYEARDLWCTRDPSTRRLVGVDAKGIQLRVLANYLKDEGFINAVLNGDPHSYNQEIGGFKTRAVAKTFIYAFLLGAGDAKVGQIIGGSTKDGREIKGKFINDFPGLSNLLADLDRQIRRTGRIVLCDGTPILVSSPHTRLGYLLQGDESRIMKRAAQYVHEGIQQYRLVALKVGDIHDEWQYDVLKDHVPRFIELCRESFARAGRSFNYNLPIACDAKVGLTWAETH